MAKIFRLHEGKATGTHWHETHSIGSTEIASIKDPAGAHHSLPITSIPSPFGRMHLVENAFNQINLQANLDTSKLEGFSVFHRLVSETLDLAELMFRRSSLNKANQKIDLIEWQADKLESLKTSFNPGHKLLADTLDLFIKQAPLGSPLRNLRKVYIIRKNFMVIGGTSPSTLFFTTPNEGNLQAAQVKIGHDTLFDTEFCPLYKREKDFVEFFYLFFEAYPQLKAQMPLMATYLNTVLKRLKMMPDMQELVGKIMQYHAMGAQGALELLERNYQRSEMSGPGSVIELMPGVYMYEPKESAAGSSGDSDLLIGSVSTPGLVNERVQGRAPLLLQNGFKIDLQYYGSARWTGNTAVPYVDNAELESRILPGLSQPYPYLTVSDFLEPYLLRLPYKLNEQYYFDGNPRGFFEGSRQDNRPPDSSHLLPLSRRFFDYFTVEDLQRSLPDGRPMFSLEKLSDTQVKAILRLPIRARGQYITFERIYTQFQAPNISATHNEGAIVEVALNLGLMPPVRQLANKRLAVIEREDLSTGIYQVELFKGQNRCTIAQQAQRSDQSKGHQASSTYYRVDEDFDYISLQKLDYKAIVIPKYRLVNAGGRSFTFAVDFGTTNSHIEYAEGNANPRPFEIGSEELQIATLNDPSWELNRAREVQDYFLYEMFPAEIGKEFSFPTRTALAEAQNLGFHGALLTFGQLNPAIYYEKYKNIRQSDIHTNLKWSAKPGDVSNTGRMRAYIESLIIMMRNKVILNGGNLSSTKIIWFYPASMDHFSLNFMASIWKELAAQYFPGARLEQISESVAPYYSVGDSKPTTAPVVNIDIGGGTSDVVIYQDTKPQLLSSFRFAGNALFSAGYAQGPSLDNGFVRHFQRYVEDFLSANYYALVELNGVFKDLTEPGKNYAADALSFFFSLEKNYQLRTRNLSFSFTQLLQQDRDFKVMYYLFYGSMIYHLAQLMKAKGLALPRYIYFSGNGSRILDLLDLSPNRSSLSMIGVWIFEKVYGQRYEAGQSLSIENHGGQPKEATCKGGIRFSNIFPGAMQEPNEVIWVGDREINLVEAKRGMRYEDARQSQVQNSVLEAVRDCFKLLLLGAYEDGMRLDYFGINPNHLQGYYDRLLSDLDGFMQAGFQARLSAAGDKSPLDETLFFYPIYGALHRLGNSIANGDFR